MLSQYGHVLMFLVFGFSFGVLNLLLASLLRFYSGDRRQKIAYECGLEPIGTPYVKTDIRFYLFALLFVIFDVEALFLFPWAVIFKGAGWLGLLEVGIFVTVLFLGLIYAWRRSGLQWGDFYGHPSR